MAFTLEILLTRAKYFLSTDVYSTVNLQTSLKDIFCPGSKLIVSLVGSISKNLGLL